MRRPIIKFLRRIKLRLLPGCTNKRVTLHKLMPEHGGLSASFAIQRRSGTRFRQFFNLFLWQLQNNYIYKVWWGKRGSKSFQLKLWLTRLIWLIRQQLRRTSLITKSLSSPTLTNKKAKKNRKKNKKRRFLLKKCYQTYHFFWLMFSYLKHVKFSRTLRNNTSTPSFNPKRNRNVKSPAFLFKEPSLYKLKMGELDQQNTEKIFPSVYNMNISIKMKLFLFYRMLTRLYRKKNLTNLNNKLANFYECEKLYCSPNVKYNTQDLYFSSKNLNFSQIQDKRKTSWFRSNKFYMSSVSRFFSEFWKRKQKMIKKSSLHLFAISKKGYYINVKENWYRHFVKTTDEFLLKTSYLKQFFITLKNFCFLVSALKLGFNKHKLSLWSSQQHFFVNISKNKFNRKGFKLQLVKLSVFFQKFQNIKAKKPFKTSSLNIVKQFNYPTNHESTKYIQNTVRLKKQIKKSKAKFSFVSNKYINPNKKFQNLSSFSSYPIIKTKHRKYFNTNSINQVTKKQSILVFSNSFVFLNLSNFNFLKSWNSFNKTKLELSKIRNKLNKFSQGMYNVRWRNFELPIEKKIKSISKLNQIDFFSNTIGSSSKLTNDINISLRQNRSRRHKITLNNFLWKLKLDKTNNVGNLYVFLNSWNKYIFYSGTLKNTPKLNLNIYREIIKFILVFKQLNKNKNEKVKMLKILSILYFKYVLYLFSETKLKPFFGKKNVNFLKPNKSVFIEHFNSPKVIFVKSTNNNKETLCSTFSFQQSSKYSQSHKLLIKSYWNKIKAKKKIKRKKLRINKNKTIFFSNLEDSHRFYPFCNLIHKKILPPQSMFYYTWFTKLIPKGLSVKKYTFFLLLLKQIWQNTTILKYKASFSYIKNLFKLIYGKSSKLTGIHILNKFFLQFVYNFNISLKNRHKPNYTYNSDYEIRKRVFSTKMNWYKRVQTNSNKPKSNMATKLFYLKDFSIQKRLKFFKVIEYITNNYTGKINSSNNNLYKKINLQVDRLLNFTKKKNFLIQKGNFINWGRTCSPKAQNYIKYRYYDKLFSFPSKGLTLKYAKVTENPRTYKNTTGSIISKDFSPRFIFTSDKNKLYFSKFGTLSTNLKWKLYRYFWPKKVEVLYQAPYLKQFYKPYIPIMPGEHGVQNTKRTKLGISQSLQLRMKLLLHFQKFRLGQITAVEFFQWIKQFPCRLLYNYGWKLKRINLYTQRLQEKQKIQFYYHLTEKKLKTYLSKLKILHKSFKLTFLTYLERRLDSLIYRIGFAPSIIASRKLITQKHILVNNCIVFSPNFSCKINDQILAKPHKVSQQLILNNLYFNNSLLSFIYKQLSWFKLLRKLNHISFTKPIKLFKFKQNMITSPLTNWKKSSPTRKLPLFHLYKRNVWR